MSDDPLFRQMADEIPGYAGAVIGDLDGGVLKADAHGVDLPHLTAEVTTLAKAWAGLYGALGGPLDFGSNDEVLISASKGYLLLKVNHERRRYLAVALAPSGNVGYLRFRVRAWLRQVLA